MRGGEATQRDNQPMTARREMTTLFNGGGGGVDGGGRDPARARGTRWVRRGRRRTPPTGARKRSNGASSTHPPRPIFPSCPRPRALPQSRECWT